MKIVRFKSKGFGCLPDGFEYSFKPEGLTLIAGNNEAGKSTLIQGILAALYGEPPNIREAKLFRESFTPWGNNQKGAQLILDVLTNSGKTFSIQRDFGSKTVRVIDAVSREDLTEQFREGRKILRFAEHPDLAGISRTSFEKTLLIMQNNLQDFHDSTDLVMSIEKILDSGETGITAETARQKLKEAECQIDPVKGNRILLVNVLRNLSNAIESCKREEAELLSEYAAYRHEIQALEKCSEEYKQLDQSIKLQEIRVSKAEQKEMESILYKQNLLKQELDDLNDKIELLKPYSDFDTEKEHQIKTLYGQIVQVRQTLKSDQAAADCLSKQLSEIDHALSAFPWQSEETNCIQIQDELEKLDRCYEEFIELEQDLDKEFKNPEAAGTDCSRFRNLLLRFGDLPEDKLQQLCKGLNDDMKIEEQLEESNNTIQKHMSIIDKLTAKKTKLRKIMIILSILAIIAAISIMSQLSTGIAGGVTTGIFLAGALSAFIHISSINKSIDSFTNELKSLDYQHEKLLQQKANTEKQCVLIKDDLQNDFPAINSSDTIKDLIWFYEKRNNELNSCFIKWKTLVMQQETLETFLSTLENLLKLKDRDEKNILNRYYALVPMAEMFKRFEKHWYAKEEIKNKTDIIISKIQGSLKTLQNLEDELNNILLSCSISSFCDFEEAVYLYNDGIKNYNELKRLSHLHEEKQRHILPNDEIERISNRYHYANNKNFSYDNFDDLNPLFEERKHLDQLNNMQNELKDQINRFHLSISDKREHYHQNLPRLKKEKESRTEQYQTYKQYYEALQFAQQTLEDISQNEYCRWSSMLNEKADYYLKSLNSPYGNARFTPGLKFSLLDHEDREYSQNGLFKNLSCGTRDQIHLALRLAITDYFCQKTNLLPLIMDDPFVNFDDDRFMQAIDSLAKIASTGRQIILLSCHTNRYQQAFPRLCRNYPEKVFLEELKQHKISTVFT